MSTSLLKLNPILLLTFSLLALPALSIAPEECTAESGGCIDKAKALPLKIISIVSILVISLIGICSPLFTCSVPALHPDRDLFIIIKCFAGGRILATGFMHVLPDSFDMLSSRCLKENPWHKFPFTGFVPMLITIRTLMVDSMATSTYSRKNNIGVIPESESREGSHDDRETGMVTAAHLHSHSHHHGVATKVETASSRLLRYRVVAVLGTVAHSVVIGLGLGASSNVCTIKGLVAALCFHQMFEGMGLGGCILQVEYKRSKKLVMVFFFLVTTLFGISLGIALLSTYWGNSPSSLITVSLLNASSAGLLIYMALVDLLAADFMGPMLQRSIKLQIKSYAAVLLGAGGMSLLAKRS